jgi:hypothetical protein
MQSGVVMESAFSRRTFLMTGAALAAAAVGGCVTSRDVPLPAGEAAALRLRSVRVDAGPLRARGLAPWADQVRAAMQPELETLFAARLAPGDRQADTLVARVDSISLASWAGGGGGDRWFGGGGSDTDYMEGYALVIGANGAERARYHILLALPASSAGAWYRPDIDNRRIAGLARTFAGWAHRRVIGR